jgi:Rod binding domain-containing protein
MNVLATHPKVEASQLSLESLAGNKNISDQDKVAEVSRQFEAVLLRQIMQDIRKPVLGKPDGDPTVSGIYGDMINNQLADSISHSGSFGLAKSLTTQLAHQVLPQQAGAVNATQTNLSKAHSHKQTGKSVKPIS